MINFAFLTQQVIGVFYKSEEMRKNLWNGFLKDLPFGYIDSFSRSKNRAYIRLKNGTVIYFFDMKDFYRRYLRFDCVIIDEKIKLKDRQERIYPYFFGHPNRVIILKWNKSKKEFERKIGYNG